MPRHLFQGVQGRLSSATPPVLLRPIVVTSERSAGTRASSERVQAVAPPRPRSHEPQISCSAIRAWPRGARSAEGERTRGRAGFAGPAHAASAQRWKPGGGCRTGTRAPWRAGAAPSRHSSTFAVRTFTWGRAPGALARTRLPALARRRSPPGLPPCSLLSGRGVARRGL